jgi:thiamine transport system permease protein
VTFLRPDIAAILALLQILFTFSLMWFYARWQRSTVVPLDLRPESSTVHQTSSGRSRAIILTLVGGFTVFMISPLAALIWRSLIDREGHLSLAYYQALPVLRRGSITFIAPLAAVRNSIGYAILTVVSAVMFGLMTAMGLSQRWRWRGLLDPIFMLPLGVSAVTLGFGYVVTFTRLRTSLIMVLIAHTLVALPFVVRTLLPVLQGIRPNLRESAAILGASPLRVWREIDLPIVSRSLLVGAVFAFTVSLGEFGATSFIVRPNSGYLTLPIAIQRYLGQPGALNYGQSMALSVILMLVCLVGFLAIERFRYADIGEF